MFNYAYRLKAVLEKRGIDVIVTRAKVEENPALTTRGSKAKVCDLFVSLHSNGVDDSRAYGVSTFWSIKRDGDAKAAQTWCDKLAALINGGTRSRGASTRRGGGDWDYYTVLQYAAKAGCPHIFLIEHGFHSNPAECKWLMDAGNMAKMAALEADIICDILGVKTSSGAEKPVQKTGGYYVVNTPHDTLNVRKTGVYTAAKLYELEDMRVVEKLEGGTTGWWRVKSGTIEGWVNSAYLMRVHDYVPYTAKVNTPGDTLNVRVLPHYKSDKLFEIPHNTQVAVGDVTRDGWRVIFFDGKAGWVNAAYLG